MNRCCAVGMLTLACGLLLAGTVHAQVRSQPATQSLEKPDPAMVQSAKLAALQSWMPRMVGRFSIMANGRQFSGVQDCVAIGIGPGVHCIRSLRGPGGADDQPAPLITLYGIDLDTPGVRYLQVNLQSIAQGAVGKLSGDTLSFRGPCPASPRGSVLPDGRQRPEVVDCESRIRIYCPPHGKYVAIQETQEMRVLTRGRRQAGTARIEPVVNIHLQRMPADWLPEPVKAN